MPVVYTQIFIWSYIKKQVEITCNSISPGQQGTIHKITVLLFHFRTSEKMLLCRNKHKFESKKENVIFKSQLEGVNQTTVSCVCLYLPKIYCVFFTVKTVCLQRNL